jgi:peptide/nickel transport system ATP-binding protein
LSILRVEDLSINYLTTDGILKAVNEVSFNIDPKDNVGIVGESGSGKTTLGLSLIKLLPNNGEVNSGKILFYGKDILKISDSELLNIRWKKISMVFQNAMNALDPLYRIYNILEEPIKKHHNMSKDDIKSKIEYYLRLVGIPIERMYDYPHELSGGMKQRIMIALSLVCEPNLVICDEPTTALDVVIQDQILDKLEELRKNIGFAMILITHNIAQVLERCDKMIVMYGGETMERGKTSELYNNIRHPYSYALINATPSIKGSKKKLLTLPGAPPNLLSPPSGCLFEPRCPLAKEKCKKEKPSEMKINSTHFSKCHFSNDDNIISKIEVSYSESKLY